MFIPGKGQLTIPHIQEIRLICNPHGAAIFRLCHSSAGKVILFICNGQINLVFFLCFSEYRHFKLQHTFKCTFRYNHKSITLRLTIYLKMLKFTSQKPSASAGGARSSNLNNFLKQTSPHPFSCYGAIDRV